MSGQFVAPAIIAMCVMALTACDQPQRVAAEVTRRDSSGVSIIEMGDPRALMLPEWTVASTPAVTIGGDDRIPGHDLFGTHHAAVLSDGGIVLTNSGSNELRFFAADGTFLRSVGGEGQGPGEFDALAWVGVMRGDTILAYDQSHARLSTLTGHGVFLGSVPVTPPHDGSFPDVRGVFAHGEFVFDPGFNRFFGQGERRDTIPFIRYDRSGSIRDTLAVRPGGEYYFAQAGGGAMRSEIPFGRDVFAAVGPSSVAIGTNDFYEVSLFDSTDGRLTTLLRARPASLPVTEDDIGAWKEGRLTGWPDDMREMVEMVHEQLPTRSTYPAFTALHIDASGFVWIRDAMGPNDAEAVWIVYAPDGAPTARVRMPPDREVIAIGVSRMVTTEQDELDREIVRVYVLNRGDS